jgi:thioesterase domain-containing protein/malonyl CoA-acyl carrier protein transacylase
MQVPAIPGRVAGASIIRYNPGPSLRPHCSDVSPAGPASPSIVAVNQSTQVAFVFGGQGPEWWGMGRELYGSEPVFATRVRECDDVLRRISGWSILEQFSATEVKSQIRRVDVGQAMLLSVHLGLAALWEEWGVVPAAVVGHAAGELSAACYAGALTTEDAMRVIVARAAVMRRLAGAGLMVAVKADAATGAELIRGLEDRVAVGVVNGPQSIVLSGEGEAMLGLAQQLSSRDIPHRVLHLPYAVYAPQMAAAAPELGRTLIDLAPVASRIPIVSTVTGDVIDGSQLDAVHWTRNIADPVQFADALATLFGRGVRAFIEIGPQMTLNRPIAECATAAGHTVAVLPSLQRGKGEVATMRKSLAALNEAKGAVVATPEKQKKGKSTGDPRPAEREPIETRIVAIHPPSAFPAMYFVGGVNIGDELYLRDVAAALGPSYQSFALLYPGMSDGKSPLADIARIAESFADHVAAHSPNQPIALVGHSVGGAIAFETARLLEQRGAKVAGLVLIDAPLYSSAATNERESLNTSERPWAASSGALRTYRPGGAFQGPTTFITPARAHDGLVECAARWREVCPTLEIHTTPGDHLTMIRAPHAANVAQSIHARFSHPDPTVS